MKHYAAIDLSLEQRSVCVVEGTGTIVRETEVASEADALLNDNDQHCAHPGGPAQDRKPSAAAA